jgi:predicted LPLAT superfamily acyltransferase
MSSDTSNYCIIVPCYEAHANMLNSTLEGMAKHGIDIIVVDDGSSEAYAGTIKDVCEKWNAIHLVSSYNTGKGGAFKLGMKFIHEQGYEYALQVDADGQHDTQTLSKLVELSKVNPGALISGRPVYDASIPKGRLFGRYITHIWVWIETLSFSITDSMCGFRCYPVTASNEVINSSRVGDHMDFDTEIMVRLFWKKIPIHFLPVKVHYPENGESYFYAFKDNWRITKMHTRLFFGMIYRFPSLVLRKFDSSTGSGWSQQEEKGSILLMKFTSFLYDILGDRFVRQLLRIICFYYYLFAGNAKKSSKEYIQIYLDFCHQNNIATKKITSFQHILSFGNMVVDKLAIWKQVITSKNFHPGDIENLNKYYDPNQGAFFISSHYGNIEITRAQGRMNSNVVYNALIYLKHSTKLMAMLRYFSPEVEDSLIAIDNFDPAMGALLAEKVEKGEWLFCSGDRITANSDKTVEGTLLGRNVSLPMGPFLMSYLLDAPVYSFHCYKSDQGYRIKVRDITPKIEKVRKNRTTYINELIKNYLVDLESLIINDPSQWFNFYKYWK